MKAYHRPDNPLWIRRRPGRQLAKFFFLCAGDGAIGFSPFGVDQTAGTFWATSRGRRTPQLRADRADEREIARLEFEGKLKTAVEEPGQTRRRSTSANGRQLSPTFSEPDGRHAPGTKDAHGAALVAQLGPDEFLVTGVDASISFHLPGKLPWIRSQIVTAEQGTYENGVWKPLRLWNGDEPTRPVLPREAGGGTCQNAEF